MQSVRRLRPSSAGILRIAWLVSLLFAAPLRAQAPQAGEYSKPTHQVKEQLGVRVPMRDGVELAVDLFLPAAEGRFPVILLQTPYGKEHYGARARWFVERGYAVANSEHRGRYNSGGEWDPFSPKHKTDGHDLVEWLGAQPWSNGRVGTYGLSFMGWAQWWTAVTAPPSLKAIVPEVSPPDHFYNGPYQHGVFVGWAMDWGATNSGRAAVSVGPGHYGGFTPRRIDDLMRLPYVDVPERRGIKAEWFKTWVRDNLATSDYWRGIAYQTPEHYGKVQVPSLAISGWFDANFPGTPMNYLGMKAHGGSDLARRSRDEARGGAFNPAKLSTIEPGRPYKYAIEFWRGTGNVFRKGHRIRIEVSSSYFPYYLRNLNTGADNIGLETTFKVANQTIFHDRDRPSHVVLPVIPAGM